MNHGLSGAQLGGVREGVRRRCGAVAATCTCYMCCGCCCCCMRAQGLGVLCDGGGGRRAVLLLQRPSHKVQDLGHLGAGAGSQSGRM